MHVIARTAVDDNLDALDTVDAILSSVRTLYEMEEESRPEIKAHFDNALNSLSLLVNQKGEDSPNACAKALRAPTPSKHMPHED